MRIFVFGSQIGINSVIVGGMRISAIDCAGKAGQPIMPGLPVEQMK